MHELSLAVNIVEIAEKEAKQEGASSVHEVIIEAGALSGVDAGILQGALEFASKNTSLETTLFTIEVPIGTGICADCGIEFEMKDILDRCPVCGGPAGEFIAGTEFRIVALKVD